MRILLIEPFFSGSHKQWAEGYQNASNHNVALLTLPGRHWKWRMFGGAVSLARQVERFKKPDLILATDMLDLATFLGLVPKAWRAIPTAIYFHENQITYPWSPDDADIALQRNNQYGFLNYTSALAADAVFFNSDFHRLSFLETLPDFLQQFPDHREKDLVERISRKSKTLPLGMDLRRIDPFIRKEKNARPVILWNHRWEYDKDPETFFRVLKNMQESGFSFQLVVLGESYAKSPAIFKQAKEQFGKELLHWGFAESYESYAHWLCKADILPVTSRQDFFGGSVVEAMYAGCYPLLPKRLAFPEHIPETFREDHLYETEEDLRRRLKEVLSMDLPQEKPWRQWVERYDWGTKGAMYDRALNHIINS